MITAFIDIRLKIATLSLYDSSRLPYPDFYSEEIILNYRSLPLSCMHPVKDYLACLRADMSSLSLCGMWSKLPATYLACLGQRIYLIMQFLVGMRLHHL
jgi:hypothetical protein